MDTTVASNTTAGGILSQDGGFSASKEVQNDTVYADVQQYLDLYVHQITTKYNVATPHQDNLGIVFCDTRYNVIKYLLYGLYNCIWAT